MPAIDVAAKPRRLQWQTVQVAGLVEETPRVRSLILNVPGWPGHKPGQHVDVRLTGEDGYQAQRSYSIASAPEAGNVTLTVERVEDGEVSPYLVIDVQKGDQFEIRGPIGGHFVWTAALGGPLFLIAGGSGIVPLMAMLRHRAAVRSKVPTTLLYSLRTYEDIIYREELERLIDTSGPFKVVYTLTRGHPGGWTGGTKRISRGMLENEGIPPTERPRVFICGPTQLVENVSQIMLELGHEPSLIKTERFGPTGG